MKNDQSKAAKLENESNLTIKGKKINIFVRSITEYLIPYLDLNFFNCNSQILAYNIYILYIYFSY